MSGARDPALEAAQRIAEGLDVAFDDIEGADPDLARGLRRLATLAQALQPRVGEGPSWGPLRDLQPIGEGSFGEVYRAFDPALDRVVALKLRRDDAPSALPSGREFIAEARRLARVRHPHVLAVHGASFHDGRAGLWTDWIDGETLSARIEARGPLSKADLLRLARELAAAIAAVHAAGLVHGDVKASNVMLDRAGHALLMDFGAGFEHEEGGSPMTAGTPRYLPPEVTRGEPATRAVDLYALGVLLHRAATARYPDRDHPPGVGVTPRALGALIARLMHDDPAQRPSATVVEQTLSDIADAPRRHARQLALGAIIAGLVGIALVSFQAYRRAETLRHEAVSARDQALASNQFLTELLQSPAPEVSGRDVTVVQLLDAAATRARAATDLAPTVRMGLLNTIGGAYFALKRLRDADGVLTDVLAQEISQGGFDDETALRLRLKLADVRNTREHYDESERVIAEALADPRWRDDPAARARLLSLRGESLIALGKYAEAEALFDRVWLTDPRIAPVDRAHMGWLFARLYSGQARHADAEAVLRQSLALAESQGRAGTQEVLWIRNQLSIALIQQGRLADAIAELRILLRQTIEAYGEHHMARIAIAGNLSAALREQGQYAESEAIIREYLEEAIKLDGPRGSSALTLRSSLAATLIEAGNHAPALIELDTLIPLEREEMGADHPQTLLDEFNRIETLNYLGQSRRALDEGRALLARMVAKFGEGHPYSLETSDAVGFALTAVGQPVEAEAIHRANLPKKAKVLGPDNPYTLTTEEYLARDLIAQGRKAEARELLESLLARREKLLGAEHRHTQRTRELLAGLADSKGK